MTGTYIIRAGAVTLNNGSSPWTDDNISGTAFLPRNSWPVAAGGSSAQVDYSSGLGPDTSTLRFTGDTVAIYVDGVATSFAGLPPGFTPTSATLFTKLQGTGTYYLQFDPFTEDAGHVSANSGSNRFYNYPYPGTIPSILSLLSSGFGIRKVIVGFEGATTLDELYISGNYSLIAATVPRFTLEAPTVPVYTGDKVKITSLTGGLDGVQQVQLSYTDPILGATTIYININIDSQDSNMSVTSIKGTGLNIITTKSIPVPFTTVILQTPPAFWFYLPKQLKTYTGPVTITIVGDGTIFSGSVVLGTLPILYEDASGIYSLIAGQAFDTLYFRNGYTSTVSSIMLPSMIDDEIYEDDFFSMLGYPKAILSQNDSDEDFEANDFAIISTLQASIVPKNVEIPSPYAKTGFLP